MKVTYLLSIVTSLSAVMLTSCSKFTSLTPEAPPIGEPGEFAQGNQYGIPGATPYSVPEAEPYQPINPPEYTTDPNNTTLPAVTSTTVADKDLGLETAYTIQKGDTLWGLSRRFGVSIDAIRQANGLQGDTIISGASINIPNR